MFVYTQYKYSFSGRGVHVEGKPEAAQRAFGVGCHCQVHSCTLHHNHLYHSSYCHSSYCSTKRRKQRPRRGKLVYQIYQPHESFWYSSNWNDLYHWTILHLVFVSLLLSVFSVLCVRSLKTNIAFAFTLQAAKPEHKKTTKMPPLALSPFCLSRLSDELSLFSDRVSMNCSEKIA